MCSQCPRKPFMYGKECLHLTFRPEIHSTTDRRHGIRVITDEIANEINIFDTMELGVEKGNLPDVVRDHPQEAESNIFGPVAAKGSGRQG